MLDIINSYVRECEKLTGIYFIGDVAINPRLSSSLGRCKWRVRKNVRTGKVSALVSATIEFSNKLLTNATQEEIRLVVAHEYAHYCTARQIGRHTHNTPKFKEYCNILNTTSAEYMGLITPTQSKYEVFCTGCNKLVSSKGTSRAGIIKHPENYTSKCCNTSVKVVKNY